MKKRKLNQKRTIIILILIFSIILIFTYKIAKETKTQTQDDILFFRLWSNGEKQSQIQNSNSENLNKKIAEYNVQVSQNKYEYQEINLLQTIDSKTLVHEKVAPGTKGEFYIILTSNSTLKYKIDMRAKNKKPQNLKFSILENQEGTIKKGERKKIKATWEWQYETSKAQNKQDTKDGENIKKYEFEICTIGE